MNVIRPPEVCEPWRTRLFLAGPSPRKPEQPTWRPEALSILERLEYDGDVFVPETGIWDKPHLDQKRWEFDNLNLSKLIVFWIPRDIKGGMLGLTTNAEFGTWCAKKPRACFYGRPDNADSVGYLDFLYHELCGKHRNIYNTLEATLQAAVDSLDL